MIFGFTADCFRILSIADVLRLHRWNGLRFSEVTTAVFKDPERSRLGAGQMKLALHLPNAGNLGYDFSSEKHSGKIRHDLEIIRRHGAWFDFQYAVFHPPEAEGSRGLTDYFIGNLQQTDLPLVMENIRGITPNAFFNLYRLMKRKLQDQLLGICLDIPHAYLTNGDWEFYYRRLRPFIRVVHLSDCRDGSDQHLPFGMGGDLSLERILRFLKQEKYDGFINFEVLPPSMMGVIRLFPMIRRLRFFLGDEFKCRIR